MPKDSYEFGFMSRKEKIKIILCKIFLAILIIHSFYRLVDGTTATLSSDFIQVSAILCAVFGYINLLKVNSELMELFEPPYFNVGYEFIIAGMVTNIVSFFV
ncbi:MAG TPA: hypothetical protein QF611_04240 [Pseudomonadales bacterium]|mgnify:FL=1|jgi:hypothetical protein|nr:hypothetical protein [Gammaproteobacteria bacterium]MDP6026924.1 hypothetical protein [Pseudomonadales bacterium]MDP6315708.1 hypothetical protein [Pseudomonadales bacterium]MDP7315866.1 hypothetical protein [Pseudomonadales bacterium]HJP50219.1 hypothetical protein [Pseudomonadales bacterium]|tara:strand:- start:99 stop:404 length:306 start_codon:yes stop_codon:yes gene_type:complete